MKKKVSVKKIIKAIFAVISVLFCLWILVSFIDVNIHNDLYSTSCPNAWNAFSLLAKGSMV